MINKKIEKAALGYCAKCSDITNRNVDLDEDECVELHNGFIDGAKWMQEEFLKDLWHPSSEEPKDNHDILIEFLNGTYTEYAAYRHNSAQLWSDFIDRSYTTRWLYIADLFPKEEDEQ